jgi:hypothetical protein
LSKIDRDVAALRSQVRSQSDKLERLSRTEAEWRAKVDTLEQTVQRVLAMAAHSRPPPPIDDHNNNNINNLSNNNNNSGNSSNDQNGMRPNGGTTTPTTMWVSAPPSPLFGSTSRPGSVMGIHGSSTSVSLSAPPLPSLVAPNNVRTTSGHGLSTLPSIVAATSLPGASSFIAGHSVDSSIGGVSGAGSSFSPSHSSMYLAPTATAFDDTSPSASPAIHTTLPIFATSHGPRRQGIGLMASPSPLHSAITGSSPSDVFASSLASSTTTSTTSSTSSNRRTSISTSGPPGPGGLISHDTTAYTEGLVLFISSLTMNLVIRKEIERAKSIMNTAVSSNVASLFGSLHAGYRTIDIAIDHVGKHYMITHTSHTYPSTVPQVFLDGRFIAVGNARFIPHCFISFLSLCSPEAENLFIDVYSPFES